MGEQSGGAAGRNETEAQRLDRNYGELLQELRVAQVGVQILFASLLTVVFSQRFTTISSLQRGTYVVTLIARDTAGLASAAVSKTITVTSSSSTEPVAVYVGYYDTHHPGHSTGYIQRLGATPGWRTHQF